MGAETFSNLATGPDARTAFTSATEQARYDHGHAGYSGTIAEKFSFKVFEVSDERRAELVASGYYGYDAVDPLWDAVEDKWGDAGCIDLKNGTFLFFGWASS